MDKINSQRIATLHPSLRCEVTALINKCDTELKGRAKVRITQALRTIAEQNALYAKGRTKPGPKVTNAKGGSSLHNYGLAFDFCLLVDGKIVSWDTAKDWDGDKQADWMEVVNIFRKAGWSWGGDWRSFKDLPHLEKTFGNTWQMCLAKYNAGKLTDGYIMV